MKTIQQWLDEYGESHQNSTNKMIHWICVPSIFFSIIGLLYSIKLPMNISSDIELSLAHVVLLLITVYYIKLSPTLAVGLALFSLGCLYLSQSIEDAGLALWKVCLSIFVIAWIFQFWGHNIEGKKPSFLKDIQYLMIGPAWLMHFIYKKTGIPY